MNAKTKVIWTAIGVITLVITIGIVGFIYFSKPPSVAQPSIMQHGGGVIPTSEISVNVSTREGTAPLTVTFIAPSTIAPVMKTGNPSYTWDLGDGTKATGRIATHTYEKPGVYTVVVEGIDEFGHTYRETITIKVK